MGYVETDPLELPQITSPAVHKNLNPVFEGSSEAKLEVKVYDSPGFGRERIEIVLWDKDRVGREYLGEVSIGLAEAWGSQQDWVGGVPPVGLDDESNKVSSSLISWLHPLTLALLQPVWHRIRSSRSRSTVSGEVLVQVGFISASASTSSSSAASSTTTTLSAPERGRILAVIERCIDEREGTRRASKEERVLLSSPVCTTSLSPLASER